MRPTLGRRLSAAVLLWLSPASLAAQAIDVAALAGDWVRDDSNYDPNDLMRITITGGTATLIRVPTTAHRAFRVGLQLWTAIAADGSLQVFGSDGQYYPATMVAASHDTLRVSVRHSAAGNAQVWRRAGPTVDGDWVRIAPGDPASDGIKVTADGDGATVRFLPAAAPRHLRIGSRLWQKIGPDGALETQSTSRQYAPAVLRLVGTDSLWVTPTGSGVAQLWVRPAIADATRRHPGDSPP